MKLRHLAATALAIAALGTPAVADEPGPGGTKPIVPATGEEIYHTVCQACHMADGKGGEGAAKIPALAGNPNLAVAPYPVTVVLNGKGAMPWFNGVLTPKQIAAVVAYARTHFGNDYPEPVTEEEVAAMAGPVPKQTH